jgi:hypothetical protein
MNKMSSRYKGLNRRKELIVVSNNDGLLNKMNLICKDNIIIFIERRF